VVTAGPGAVLARGAGWLVAGAAVVAASLLLTDASTALYLAVDRSGLKLPYGAADTLLILLAVGFLLAAWGLRRVHADRLILALLVGSSAVAAYLTNEALKLLIAQQRPCIDLIVDPRCPGPDSWSFPSNHTAIAFALATATVLVALTRWAWCAYIAAVAAAASRVIDGVHYPHDVAAGAAVGTCVTACCALLVGYAVQRRRRRADEHRTGEAPQLSTDGCPAPPTRD